MIYSLSYCLLGIVEVFFEWQGDQQRVRNFKPMIMAHIFFWVLNLCKKLKLRSQIYFLTGVVFAWLGDIFLLGNEDIHFAPGLGAFLVMQIFYILSFSQLPSTANTVLRLFYISIWIFVNWLIHDGAMDLAVPVMVYSAFLCATATITTEVSMKLHADISATSTTATTQDGDDRESKSVMLLKETALKGCRRLSAGSVLFLVSDCVIALTKFGVITHSTAYQAFVMVTYILAQGLIAHSFIFCLHGREKLLKQI